MELFIHTQTSTVQVWERISNFILYFRMDITTTHPGADIVVPIENKKICIVVMLLLSAIWHNSQITLSNEFRNVAPFINMD